VLYEIFTAFAIPALFFMIPIAIITWLKYPYNSKAFNLRVWDSGDWDFKNWDWDNGDRLKFATYIGIPAAFLLTPIIMIIIVIPVFLAEIVLAIPAYIILGVFGGLKWKDIETFGKDFGEFIWICIPTLLIFFLIFVSISTLITKLNHEKFIFKNLSYWTSAIISFIFFVLIIISFNYGETNADLVNAEKGHSAVQKNNISSLNEKSNKKIGNIIVNAANIRTGPSTKYPIMAVLKKKEQFKILSSKNGWSKIRFNGKQGYVYNKLIQIEK